MAFRKLAEKQTEHPILERMSAEALMLMGVEQAVAVVEAREEAIENMTRHPMECCWVPDDWWLFLLELVKKRLEHPGAVLELFVSGGIRSGKSFIGAWLSDCHWMYTPGSFVFCLSETEETSKDLQQVPIEYFLPPAVTGGARGSIKQNKHERLKFSGGAFTGGAFERYLNVEDENGNVIRGGGKMRFRFFSQSVRRYRGFAVSFAWCDEAAPVDHVQAVNDRLASRAIETKEPGHVKRMQRLKHILERLVDKRPGAERPHPALLGALMHGVLLLTYTPEEGWTPTVRRYLQGAEKPERFKVVAPELSGRPGVLDPKVPRIAYPAVSTRMVGYLHTSQNRMVNVYPEESKKSAQYDERTVRIKLYGDAESAEDVLFGPSFDMETHVIPWARVPRDLTVYEILDPASARPYVFMWVGVDVAGRLYVLQEWPCPSVRIEGNMPGEWAVTSRVERVNGDEGPAQKLRLRWGPARYVGLAWEMRRRLFQKFETTGGRFEGRSETVNIGSKSGAFPWEVSGEVVTPYEERMDSRFAKTAVGVGDEVVTLQDALVDAEHGILYLEASGVPDEVGNTQIASKLNERLLGMPGLMVVEDCENTIFMLRNYALPPFSETTRRRDEACVDFRDALAYAVLAGPEHVPASAKLVISDGGNY